MEFKEENSLYECIKPLPIAGGFNISDHQEHLAVIFELCKDDKASIKYFDFDKYNHQSIGWDKNSILSSPSKINYSETLEFKEYFKLLLQIP